MSKAKKVSIFDEFNVGLENSINNIKEINNSLVALMYPTEGMQSVIKILQRNKNIIYIPWENKVL